MNKILIIIILSILLISFPSYSDTKLNDNSVKVAVLPFKIDGDTETLSQHLVSIAVEEVKLFEKIELFTPDSVSGNLAMMGETDKPCYEPACLSEYGKELGVDILLIGFIKKISPKYLVEIKLIDVAGKKLHDLESGDVNGVNGSLDEKTAELVRSVLKRLVNRPGLLVIDTYPEKSRVAINGHSIGFAPIEIEKPGGSEYKLSGIRFGYVTREREVFLAEGDTVEVNLKLKKKPKDRKPKSLTRFWGTAGWPLVQASSSFDFNVKLKGSAYGIGASFGERWRIRFGVYRYESIVKDLDESYRESYDVVNDPDASANVYYSAIIYVPFNRGTGPKLGFGIGALNREISIQSDSFEDDSRSTDLEVGWLLQLGFEFELYRQFAAQLELLNVNVIGDRRDWENEGEDLPEIWNKSFKSFSSFTTFSFGIGYKF